MTGKQANRSWVKRMRETGGVSINGFQVEAQDGNAGRIDEVLYWSDNQKPDYIIVGTGRWFFGHKSVLPVDAIEDVDLENRRLRVRLSRAQVRKAPEFLPCV
jgi:hypothetical protein